MTDSFVIRNSTFGICPFRPKGNANFAWVQHFIYQPNKKENHYVV